MALALKRIRVYSKLIAIGTIVVLVLLLVGMNIRNKTNIWFFHHFEQVPVLWVILITAFVSVISWWSLRKITATIREYKELRRTAQMQEQLNEQRCIATELQEREKRIDDKIRRSLTENSDSPGGGQEK